MNIYKGIKFSLFLLLMFFVFFQGTAFAYVGPGAGFALLTSFFTLFIAFFLAILSVLSWPVRTLYRILVGKNAHKNSLVDRVVIVGLDGLDPKLAEKYMAQGKMPNFSKLKESGTFNPLQTTYPSISPVAWSSFLTGVNPGKHNIFDFLSRDKRTYLPVLSSAHIGGTKRSLKIGKFIIPIGKPIIRLLRKSHPFWNVLGKQGVFSTILRVPITFPPEKFNGLLLSGMCVPDLKGTQGSFVFYTTADGKDSKHTGGERIQIQRQENKINAFLSGPPNPVIKDHKELKIPFTITFEENKILLQINNHKIELKEAQYSDWIELTFKTGLGIKVSGICRFLVTKTNPDFELYVTPININPEKAALPVSFPNNYATYLSKYQGSFATLGLAEDTWALNERVIDEKAFLKQCYDHHEERETMFFNALDKTEKGLCVCVFDTTDRIQHMFLRFLDPEHPAIIGYNGEYKNVIEDLYKKMDDLVGRVMKKIDDKTVLMVMSDHGFKQFKRGLNLNTWLHQNGYLFLREEQELIEKLTGLKDEEKKLTAINEVFDSSKVYSGPYQNNALDLIVGYNEGYRASWNSVTGKIDKTVFSDNTKSWGGDHCLDPRLVPGVFFSNNEINSEKPGIIDIAPTVLKLFGIKAPGYIDGVSLI